MQVGYGNDRKRQAYTSTVKPGSIQSFVFHDKRNCPSVSKGELIPPIKQSGYLIVSSAVLINKGRVYEWNDDCKSNQKVILHI